MSNYVYACERVFAEKDEFKLFLLPSRKERRVYNEPKDCRLCIARKEELIIKESCLASVVFNRYPIITKSVLFVLKKHSAVFGVGFLQEIVDFLRLNSELLAFCNNFSSPSIPQHLHFDLIQTLRTSQSFQRFVHGLPSKHGWVEYSGVYLYIMCLTERRDIEIAFLQIQKLVKEGIKFNLILGKNFISFHIVKDVLLNQKVNLDSKSIAGLFTTTNKDKFEYMKNYGLKRILLENSLVYDGRFSTSSFFP